MNLTGVQNVDDKLATLISSSGGSEDRIPLEVANDAKKAIVAYGRAQYEAGEMSAGEMVGQLQYRADHAESKARQLVDDLRSAIGMERMEYARFAASGVLPRRFNREDPWAI